MVNDRLLVRFEGLDIGEEGVSLDDLQKTLRHVQNAFRYMVRHLTGYNRGRQPDWLRKESELRLTGISAGSLVAELSVASTEGLNEVNGPGQEAIARLLEEEDLDLWPERVVKEWLRIGQDLSSQVDTVSLELPSSGQRKEFPPRWEHTIAGDPSVLEAPMLAYRAPPMPERALPTPEALMSEAALVHGRLRAVDWVERTAKLVPYMGRTVDLRFAADHDLQMLELAMQHVEVKGQGQFDSRDEWLYIQIEEIRGTGSLNEPFDLEAFLNNPTPRMFDPDRVIRASEPFDVDEFIRVIREGRDVGKEGDSL